MPLRADKVVIGDDVVTRFNGNNPTGGRESGRPGLRQAPVWVQKKAQAAARRRQAEAVYRRRYLGGN